MRVFNRRENERVGKDELAELLDRPEEEWREVERLLASLPVPPDYRDLYHSVRAVGMGERYLHEAVAANERRSNRRTALAFLFSLAVLGGGWLHYERNGNPVPPLVACYCSYQVAVRTMEGNSRRNEENERMRTLLGR